jgi:hypothetical protein
MWTYKQSTGEFLRPDGTRLGFGFAGNGTGLNNPDAQAQHNVGPLPQGTYTMTAFAENDPHTGMCTIVLIMDTGEEDFGRSAFRIHGPVNLTSAGLNAFLHSSDGCIILGDCVLRRGIWANKDHKLKVTA